MDAIDCVRETDDVSREDERNVMVKKQERRMD